jgi:TPR repeat protein
MYYNGYGVRRNYELARIYFQMAAEQGSSDAQASLGIIYTNGYGLRVPNHRLAHYWFRLAAAQGNRTAIKALRGTSLLH